MVEWLKAMQNRQKLNLKNVVKVQLYSDRTLISFISINKIKTLTYFHVTPIF